MSEPTSATIWIKNSVTVVETDEYGPLEFRKNLSGFFVLHSLESNQPDLKDRDFAIGIILLNLLSPKLGLEIISSWPDNLLIRCLKIWGDEIGLDPASYSDASIFHAFRQTYLDYARKSHLELYDSLQKNLSGFTKSYAANMQTMTETLGQIQLNIGQTLTKLIETSAQSMALSVQQTFKSITDTIRPLTSQFFTNLPTISDILISDKFATTQAKLEAEGLQVIQETGYSEFMFEFLAWSLFVEVAETKNLSPQIRSAVVTNRLLAVTRQHDFILMLEDIFQSTNVLKRRWKVINCALIAHQERKYLLSIPTLLAQIEGIFADMLILKDIVFIDNLKLYERENGKPRLGRDGKWIEVNGLGGLLRCSKFKQDPEFQSFACFLADRLIQDRNGILHGRKTSYGYAKISVQAVFVLLFLSFVIKDFENGKIAM